MPSRSRKLTGAAIAASGAALLICAATVQPAAALPYSGVAFYTGADRTGTEIPVDLDSTGCENLQAPALSAANFSDDDIEVYYNANCQAGAPGTTGDQYFVLGSLHTSTFPHTAVSYRVRG